MDYERRLIMARFKGISGISDFEAKTAQVIEDLFFMNGSESFSNWIKNDRIKLLYWWDYCGFKNKSNLVLVPFFHFEKLIAKDYDYFFCTIINLRDSLRYLVIPRETAMKIVALRFLPLQKHF